MTAPYPRRLATELLGTAILLAIVVGSGIMADRLSDDDAVALLGNTIATSAGLFVLVLIFAPVSGAHFNPAVTLVFALRREIAPGEAVGFAIAQLAGGAVGVALAHLMFELPVIEVSQTVRAGPGPVLGEAVATFWLLLTILGVLSVRPDRAPLAIALCIAAGYWFTSSTSFANPAVTAARTLTDTFAGVRPADAPGFIVAQAAGALAAFWAGGLLFTRRDGDYRAPDAGAVSTLQQSG